MYVTYEWVISHAHKSRKQIMPHTYKPHATTYTSRVCLYLYVCSYVCIYVFMPQRRSHLTRTNHATRIQVSHTQVTHTPVTHTKVTCNNLPPSSMYVTYEWVISHTYKSRHSHMQQPAPPEHLCHIWMRECIMSHTHMSYATHTQSHAQQPAPPEYLCHIYTHTQVQDTSHTHMSRATTCPSWESMPHMNESCHTWVRHVTHKRVTSHIKESCHT